MNRCMKFIVVCALVLGRCNILQAQAPLQANQGYRKDSIKGLEKPVGALHFLALGDWGRNGENYQKEVAEGMGKAAHDIGARFIIATGDNFYPNGVASVFREHLHRPVPAFSLVPGIG
jgi:tartrate-resistant acid phosphatase type 5